MFLQRIKSPNERCDGHVNYGPLFSGEVWASHSVSECSETRVKFGTGGGLVGRVLGLLELKVFGDDFLRSDISSSGVWGLGSRISLSGLSGSVEQEGSAGREEKHEGRHREREGGGNDNSGRWVS